MFFLAEPKEHLEKSSTQKGNSIGETSINAFKIRWDMIHQCLSHWWMVWQKCLTKLVNKGYLRKMLATTILNPTKSSWSYCWHGHLISVDVSKVWLERVDRVFIPHMSNQQCHQMVSNDTKNMQTSKRWLLWIQSCMGMSTTIHETQNVDLSVFLFCWGDWLQSYFWQSHLLVDHPDGASLLRKMMRLSMNIARAIVPSCCWWNRF